MLAFEHLPSELYEFVFMYLKSNDILVSFMNLNKRFTKLVHYQICRKVDVSLSKSDFHDILHYVQSTMQSIKLNDNQLNKVFPTTITSYPNLRSIILNNIPHVNGKYSVHIESFKTLYSLTLNFLFQCETPEIDQHVLFNKCSLEKLFITNCVLSLDSSNSIQMCQSIKYLTIKIQYQHHLFMLMENFPSLVYLNIQITKGIKSTDSYDYINGKLLPLNLKQFILDSSVKRIQYDHLEYLLSKQFKLEYLSINIRINHLIDGRRLEYGLLSKLSKLKQFNFHIHCYHSYVSPNIMSTFQSKYWLQHPMMYYHNSNANLHTLASLPFIYDYMMVSNGISEYQSNIQCNLMVPNVKYLVLYNATEPSTLKLCHFLKTIVSKNAYGLLLYGPCRFDDDMMNDTSVTLSTITMLQLGFDNGEYRYIKRLLLLTPNVRKLHIKQELLLNIKEQLRDDHELRELICQNITQLTMFQRNQNGLINNINSNEIRIIFPNAAIVSEHRDQQREECRN